MKECSWDMVAHFMNKWGIVSYSLDALFGIALPQPWLFLVLAVAALLVDIIGIAISRPAKTVSAEARPSAS